MTAAKRNTMRRITELTPEQLAGLDSYAEEWAKMFYSPGPADRAKVEDAVIAAYLQAGVEPPEKIIWYASPHQAFMAMLLMHEVYYGRSAFDKDVGVHFYNYPPGPFVEYYYYVVKDVRESAYIRAKARMTVDVIDTIAVRYEGEIFGYLGHGWQVLGDLLGRSSQKGWRRFRDPNAEFYASLIGSSEERPEWSHNCSNDISWQRKTPYGTNVPDRSYTTFEDGFVSRCDGIYRYLLEGLGFDECLPYSPHVEIAKQCSWWWPLEKIAIMADKHVFISRDQGDALHNMSGMALRYGDGFGLFAVHGNIIPAKWGRLPARLWEPSWLYETDNLFLQDMLTSMFTYERLLRDMESVLVHESGGMELRRIDGIPNDPWLLLKVVCPSTGKTVILRVPPESTDCEEARRWTFGDEGIWLVDET